ncbi:hypothetical protein GGR51DRAFT_577988 [Nemania sp. FL0031]|nr:hypothetical protein GGR51DRAFT_577988 [Nemania sp. FL0031]
MTTDSLFRCRLGENKIIVDLAPSMEKDHHPQSLTIDLNRTIRVPDNKENADLPPGLGTFPLFRVRDYAANFPPTIAKKGGIFFPMYQREAMWIDFTADRPFMIKIYAGGVNVVSGEHSEENAETKNRRRELISKNKSIQDYIVVPPQPWLDGFAVTPGIVRQFVAMPLGSGYSVEAQLTGQEVIGCLQFEITPSLPEKREVPLCNPLGGMTIYVKLLTGKLISIRCSPDNTVDDLKQTIRSMADIYPDRQRLIFAGKQLEDGRRLADCNIETECVVYMAMRIMGGDGGHGGHGGHGGPRMAVAAGGKIDQVIHKDERDPSVWVKDSTITVPVHILTTDAFQEVTGQSAPPCPISASTYASADLPFFGLPEEPSSISGDFGSVKSVNTIDVQRGIAAGEEPSVRPRVITLQRNVKNCVDLATIEDPDGLVSPDGPLRDFRTLTTLLDETVTEGRDGF